MQTFLPYSDFRKSAKTLDRMRLGKQRVETLQILQTIIKGDSAKGWKNHPAVKMWRGHELCLAEYGAVICDEWTSRGYSDTCKKKIYEIRIQFMTKLSTIEPPNWLGNLEFHASHRSNLLRKKPEFYSQYNWEEGPNLPYIWPV